MAQFNLKEILQATKGKIIRSASFSGLERSSWEKRLTVDSVSIDTRTQLPEALFIAIKGENFDGHDFLTVALQKQASILLVQEEDGLDRIDPSLYSHAWIVLWVKDTLMALQQLALAYRWKLNCKVVGITGSVGKTSTREMIALALKDQSKVHSTKANFNNEIGLPLTILSAPEDTEIMVLEMGMRLRGEIEALTKIACPNIAVITNIGLSHIERLGSQTEILQAKMEICQGLVGEKWLVIPENDPFLIDYVKHNSPLWGKLALVNASSVSTEKQGISTSTESAVKGDMKLDLLHYHFSNNQTEFSFSLQEENFFSGLNMVKLPVVGKHHLTNAMIAIAVAKICSYALPRTINNLAEIKILPGRGKLISTTFYQIFDDSYNASTTSMLAAIDSVSVMGKNVRKVAILGGMMELGEWSEEEHFKVGQALGKAEFGLVILIGPWAEAVKNGIQSISVEGEIHIAQQIQEVIALTKKLLQKKDFILIKGSYSFQMFKVVEALVKEEESEERNT